jgi:signal transduction histidine kinase
MAKRRIAVRLYVFVAAIVVATMAALYVLPRFISSPRFLEPQAALVQNMVDRLSLRDPAKQAEVMARLQQRLHGKLALLDQQGHLIRGTAELPDIELSPSDLDALFSKGEKWTLGWGRIVVRSDDSTLVGVYEPQHPGFPWAFVIPLGAGILFVAGGLTLWFSRRLVRPLEQLADAARKFGTGDTAARAKLKRDDELGDVGHAFDDMADRTAAVIQAQRQLMADVSHELRTPLARIRVALELAAEDPVAAKDVLRDVGTDLDEIDQLIADILVTARLDTDRSPLTRRETTVGELAHQAVQRFTARHPGRSLEQKLAEEGRTIDVDPTLLRRALDNLLDNAAKYSPSDKPVALQIVAQGDAIAFEVLDRGIGMSPEELERAGTPFWRADGSRTRATGGVGLGLALARRIARAHGGDVKLASKLGEGTTARLEVPL